MLRCFAPLAFMLLAGCATLTGSRMEYLKVESIPPGASVSVNGVGGGYTPASVEVDKQHPPLVEVSMAGQPPVFCSTAMSASTGYIVADVVLCVLLFPIGCISFIDAAGAWNELEHPVCSVNLSPGAPPAQPPPPPPPPPRPPSHD